MYAFIAEFLVVLHGLFIAFALFGGLLCLWREGIALVHLPAVGWAAWIEFTRGICPLTPLENRYRMLAGEEGYQGGFIEHYLLPLIYPPGLTAELQLAAGIAVVLINCAIYAAVFRPGRGRVDGHPRHPHN